MKKIKIMLVLITILSLTGCSAGCQPKGNIDAPPPLQSDISGGNTQSADDSAPTQRQGLDDNKGDKPGTGNDQDSNIICVTIREDKVFVNDVECKNADELNAYIQQIYSDQKVFKLYDERSILATYEWVESVFLDLGIELVHK